MTNHLAECLAYCTCEEPALCMECICDALRACEQRVIEEGDYQSQIAYDCGYATAIDQAEAAVHEASFGHCECEWPIAAIRALRGEQ